MILILCLISECIYTPVCPSVPRQNLILCRFCVSQFIEILYTTPLWFLIPILPIPCLVFLWLCLNKHRFLHSPWSASGSLFRRNTQCITCIKKSNKSLFCLPSYTNLFQKPVIKQVYNGRMLPLFLSFQSKWLQNKCSLWFCVHSIPLFCLFFVYCGDSGTVLLKIISMQLPGTAAETNYWIWMHYWNGVFSGIMNGQSDVSIFTRKSFLFRKK